MALKNPLASKVFAHTGNVVDSSDLAFLKGVASALTDKSDLGVIKSMITAIEDGAVFDLHEEY
jgi:hypothetical protein